MLSTPPRIFMLFSGNSAANLVSYWGVLKRRKGQPGECTDAGIGRRKVGTWHPAFELLTVGIVMTVSSSLKEILSELLAEMQGSILLRRADSLAMSLKTRAALVGMGCIWTKLTSSALGDPHLHLGLQQISHLVFVHNCRDVAQYENTDFHSNGSGLMTCLQSSFSSRQPLLPLQFRVPRLNGFRNQQCIQKGILCLQKAREAAIIISYFQAKNNPKYCLLKRDSQQFSTIFGKLSTALLQNAAVLGTDTPRTSIRHSSPGSHPRVRWSTRARSYTE